MKTYKALQAKNLPIPADLKAEVEQVLGGGAGAPPSPGGMPGMPGGGAGAPGGPGGPGGGPGEGIVMPPMPPGIGPPGGGLGPTGIGTGAPGTPGSTPPIAPNGQGIGNGFAPPASFERRPGMPRPSSVQLDVDESQTKFASSVHSKSDTETDTDTPEPEAVEEERTESLPKASNRKSYSFLEEDEVAPTKEKDEHDDEPIGRVPKPDRGVDGGKPEQ
jgi:hypothetical protein